MAKFCIIYHFGELFCVDFVQGRDNISILLSPILARFDFIIKDLQRSSSEHMSKFLELAHTPEPSSWRVGDSSDEVSTYSEQDPKAPRGVSSVPVSTGVNAVGLMNEFCCNANVREVGASSHVDEFLEYMLFLAKEESVEIRICCQNWQALDGKSLYSPYYLDEFPHVCMAYHTKFLYSAELRDGTDKNLSKNRAIVTICRFSDDCNKHLDFLRFNYIELYRIVNRIVVYVNNRFVVSHQDSRKEREVNYIARREFLINCFRVNNLGSIVLTEEARQEFSNSTSMYEQCMPSNDFVVSRPGRSVVYECCIDKLHPDSWTKSEKVPSCVNFLEVVELNDRQVRRFEHICRDLGFTSNRGLICSVSYLLNEMYQRYYFSSRVELYDLVDAFRYFVSSEFKLSRFNKEGEFKRSHSQFPASLEWQKKLTKYLYEILCLVTCKRFHKHRFMIALEIANGVQWGSQSKKYDRVKRSAKYVNPVREKYIRKDYLREARSQMATAHCFGQTEDSVDDVEYEFVLPVNPPYDENWRTCYDVDTFDWDAPFQAESQMFSWLRGPVACEDDEVDETESFSEYLHRRASEKVEEVVVDCLHKPAVQKAAGECIYSGVKSRVFTSFSSIMGFMDDPLSKVSSFVSSIYDKACELTSEAYSFMLSPKGIKTLQILFGVVTLCCVLVTTVVTVKLIKAVASVFMSIFDIAIELRDKLLYMLFDVCKTAGSGVADSQSFWTIPAGVVASIMGFVAISTGTCTVGSLNQLMNVIKSMPSIATMLSEGFPSIIEWIYFNKTGNHFLDSADRFEAIVKTIAKVEKLIQDTDYDSDAYLTDVKKVAKLANVYEEMEKHKQAFREMKDLNRSLYTTFMKLQLRITELHLRAEKFSTSANERMETVALWLYGEPQVGKTQAIQVIHKAWMHLMRKEYGDDEYPPFGVGSVWNATRGSKYKEGLTSKHKISNHGEVLQESSEDLNVDFCMSFLNMCESAPYCVDMAFEGKGKVFYKCELCTITSNLPLTYSKLQHIGIRYPEAMVRRMTFPLELKRDYDKPLKSDLSNLDESWYFVLNVTGMDGILNQPREIQSGFLKGVSKFLRDKDTAFDIEECLTLKSDMRVSFRGMLTALFEESVERKNKRPHHAEAENFDWENYIDPIGDLRERYGETQVERERAAKLSIELENLRKEANKMLAEDLSSSFTSVESQGGKPEWQEKLEKIHVWYYNNIKLDYHNNVRDRFLKRAIKQIHPDFVLPQFWEYVYNIVCSSSKLNTRDVDHQVHAILDCFPTYVEISSNSKLFNGLSIVNEFLSAFGCATCYYVEDQYKNYVWSNSPKRTHPAIVDVFSQICSSKKVGRVRGFSFVDWTCQPLPLENVEKFSVRCLFDRFVDSMVDAFKPLTDVADRVLISVGLKDEMIEPCGAIMHNEDSGFLRSSRWSYVAKSIFVVLGVISSCAAIVSAFTAAFPMKDEDPEEEILRMLLDQGDIGLDSCSLVVPDVGREAEVVSQTNHFQDGYGWEQCSVSDFRSGDVLGVVRVMFDFFQYIHVGVVVKDNLEHAASIIHFSGEIYQKIGASVRVDDLETFLNGSSRISLVRLVVPVSDVLSPVEVVRRARARLGDSGYHALRNNCEHFAFECKTGTPRSPQAVALCRSLVKSQTFDQMARQKRVSLQTFNPWNCRMKRAESQSFDQRSRMKMMKECVMSQSIQQCMDRVVKVSANTHIFRIIGKYTNSTVGLFGAGRVAVIPLHAWVTCVDMTEVHVCNKVGDIMFPFRSSAVQARVDKTRDLVFLTFPKTMPERVNLARNMPSKSKLFNEECEVVRVETAVEDLRHNTVVVSSNGVKASSTKLDCALYHQSGVHITELTNYLSISNCPGRNGLCGTAYVSVGCNDGDWLKGIHVAGKAFTSYAGPLYREDFDLEEAESQMKFELHYPSFVMDRVTLVSADDEIRAHIPKGVQLIGKVRPEATSGLKDSHVESRFQYGDEDHPQIFPVTTAPTRLRRFRNEQWELVDPTKMASDKMMGPKVCVGANLAALLEDQPQIGWQGFCPPPNRRLRRYSFRDALFGNSNRGITAFDNTTSSGWRGRCFPSRHTRRHWFDLQTGWFDPDLERAVMLVIAHWERGEVYMNVTEFCLKAELRDLLRVMQGKTRGFHVGDLVVAIATKMVLGDAVQWLKDSRHQGTNSIGTNVHDVDWKLIYDYLNAWPDIAWLEFDAEGFDTTVQPWVAKLMGKFFNSLYMYSPNTPEWCAVMSACLASVGCLMVIGDIVIRLDHMNPSGSWMTGITNTFANHVYRNLFFHFTRNFCLMSGCNCLEHMKVDSVFRSKFYGDDAVQTVKRAFLKHFNMLECKSFYKSVFGINLTNADKSELVDEERSPETITFLSRKFRRQGPFVFAPLEKSSIEALALWVSSTFTTQEAQDAQLSLQTRIIMEESYYHGREYFEEMQGKLLEYCRAFNIPYQGETFEFWARNYALVYRNGS